MAQEAAILMTQNEAREWYQIRDHVKEAVYNMELCDRCLRLKKTSDLVSLSGLNVCRPGDHRGCMAH